jgi:MFS family permease
MTLDTPGARHDPPVADDLTPDATADAPGGAMVRPTPEPDRRGGFRALAYPGFRLYFAGMLARGTAVWMQLVMIPLLAVQLGASPLELGAVTALLFLPTLLMAALGGVLADRVDRGRVLLVTQAGSGTLSLSLCLLLVADAAALGWVAVAALSFGILTAFELPVRQAYLTELVPKDDVTSAVSLHATAWNTTRFIGPVVAGVLIATVGSAAAFLVAAAIAYLVSLTVLWMERYREPGRQRDGSATSVLADLKEGAAFALQEPGVRWPLVLVAAGGILGIQAFQTLAPLYGTEELGLEPGLYGLYLGLWGAGAVVAAFVVTAFARGDRRPWLIGGTLSMALLLGAIAIVGLVPVAFALAFALGFAQIVLIQNALISVQAATPDALRGRVMGIYVTVFQGSSPFGALLAGWLAELVGVRGAMLAGASGLAIVGLGAAVALRRVGMASLPVRPGTA